MTVLKNKALIKYSTINKFWVTKKVTHEYNQVVFQFNIDQ